MAVRHRHCVAPGRCLGWDRAPPVPGQEQELGRSVGQNAAGPLGVLTCTSAGVGWGVGSPGATMC